MSVCESDQMCHSFYAIKGPGRAAEPRRGYHAGFHGWCASLKHSATRCNHVLGMHSVFLCLQGAAEGLSNRVSRMLASIEKELDAVESKIGKNMHVLDQDQDGACSFLLCVNGRVACVCVSGCAP